MSLIKDAARAATMVGLVALPTRRDGSKAPALAKYEHFYKRKPTTEESRAMWAGDDHVGLGILAHHRVDPWDFDHRPTFDDFVEEARKEVGDLFDRGVAGYCDETPNGGRRVLIFRPNDVPFKDVTLAALPLDGGKVKTLIELPTHAILAPSTGAVHPSGKPYVHLNGDFSTIFQYTEDEREALITLARRFDQMPRRERQSTAAARTLVDGVKPGVDFNARATWPSILEAAGWRIFRESGDETFWTRPGKDRGISASTNVGGSGLLYVFSSSTCFRPHESYSKFAAYALLNHNDDFSAAARALRQQGYGGAPTNGHGYTPVQSGTTAQAGHPVLVRLSTVQPEAIDWTWAGRLARGKATISAGDPGIGKSQITLDVAARCSIGAPWPDGGSAPLGDTIILAIEDGIADTIRPRIDALGGDPSRIHVLEGVSDPRGNVRMLSLARDLGVLEEAIREIRPVLVVIDPITAYLGNTDSYKDAEVRGVLAPLLKVIADYRVALAWVAHLSKDAQRAALHRPGGSVAFVAAARLAFAVAADPNNPERRIVAPLKANIAKFAASLAFTIPDTVLTWEAEPAHGMDAATLLAPVDRDAGKTEDAEDFLRELLADGPVESNRVFQAARANGLSEITVKRAKTKLGIKATRSGFGPSGKWFWTLPSAIDAHTVSPSPVMSPFGENEPLCPSIDAHRPSKESLGKSIDAHEYGKESLCVSAEVNGDKF